jgi:tRNA modification GTPase
MTARDTIFALSSGAGRSAVSVIRISGPACGSLLSSLIGRLPKPRELTLRVVRHPGTYEPLDKALSVWLPAPGSFTGEDCAELHLHGSPAVITAVMAAMSDHPSVRPAEAGEFTQRAFLNGKMDLVEAEGLADLLEARTSAQRRQALRQMSGVPSSTFDAWRQQLLLIRADIEAVVDFADEPGVAEEAAGGIDGRIRDLLAQMISAVHRSAMGEVVRDGVSVVLAGLPNTGKSSLLNALARRDAAIVSDVPGTTRDAIEVSLDIRGIPVVLTDTAGLREDVSDAVEREGVRRSALRMKEADIIVWVWSADVAGSASPVGEPSLVVQNKCDLESGLLRNENPGASHVSTRTGLGIEEFIERLSALLQLRFGDVESSLLVNARQVSAAQNSIRLLNEALAVPPERLELKAEEIRLASDEIGRLTGKVGVEEWLGAIFSRFCIGK